MPSRHTDDIKRQNEEKGQDYLPFNKSSTKFNSADKRFTVGFFVIRGLNNAGAILLSNARGAIYRACENCIENCDYIKTKNENDLNSCLAEDLTYLSHKVINVLLVIGRYVAV